MRLLGFRRGLTTAVYIAQHKPYSFLAPSPGARGNKRYAVDLLKRSNGRGQADQRRLGGDPGQLDGLRCAGRLDADSTGLMLWSTDRRFVERVIGPSANVEKEYLVRVTGHEEFSDKQFAEAVGHLRHGIYLDGEPLRPAAVRWLNEAQLQVTLTEGRHRQIRRMLDLVGWTVTALKRVRIGNLRLGGLDGGKWTELSGPQAANIYASRQGALGDTRSAVEMSASDLSQRHRGRAQEETPLASSPALYRFGRMRSTRRET